MFLQAQTPQPASDLDLEANMSSFITIEDDDLMENSIEIKPESKSERIDRVALVFPGICREHVSNLYETFSAEPESIVDQILEQIGNGEPYPKAKETQKLLDDSNNILKRKRQSTEELEAELKAQYTPPGRYEGGYQKSLYM